jgi:hypothetical protein
MGAGRKRVTLKRNSKKGCGIFYLRQEILQLIDFQPTQGKFGRAAGCGVVVVLL